MRLVLGSGGFFALVGLCFSAPLLRLQLTNPTYAILTLEHYRAYYSFYMLGALADRFARLGSVAAALLISYFVLWAANRVGLVRYLRLSARGEQFSWAWRSLAVMTVVCLGLILQAGWLLATATDLAAHNPGPVHLGILVSLALVPALLLAKIQGPSEHLILRWPLALLVMSGSVTAYYGADLASQLFSHQYLIPPIVSTHYGPWGMLGWLTGLGFFLGLAVGIMLLGITPRPQAEPGAIRPIPARNLALATGLSVLVTVALAASYPFYFVPRYQLGQDLVTLLGLKREEVAGRTVVWLDAHDPPHTLEPFQSFSTPSNLAKVEHWMVSAPIPSALTRPAAKMLGDHSLFQWQPADALDWLEVHRRRLHFSNLNRAFLEVIGSTHPSPRTSQHLEALTDPARFAWPGPGSRLELAAQMRRYGWDERAAQWEASARELGAELLPPVTRPVPEGSLAGRLLLDGKPLAGARIALFRGEDEEELLERTRQHVARERELIDAANWRPTYYQYMDFQRLADFYAVGVTDAEGYFYLDALDSGLYRLAVRLDSPARAVEPGGLKVVEAGHQELGEIRLLTEPRSDL